jgi:hypothetical protein
MTKEQVKRESAKGKATAKSVIIPESRFWGYTFAFCTLRFAF